jgi:phytoene synthase
MSVDGEHVSDLMRSGAFDGQTDDRLKDEDNVAWVMGLPDRVRDDWLSTLEWGRVADRLVESAVLGPAGQRETGLEAFSAFSAAWARLRRGTVPMTSQFGDLFVRLEERWRREGLAEPGLLQWDRHLDALWHYRRPDEVILTMADYARSLHDLSGTFFQACPYQPAGLAEAVSALGALDQFFNNLRDLHEDTARGITYLPPDLLDRFGIGVTELPTLVERVDHRLERLFGYLLSTIVAELRLQAAPLFSASGLHESWHAMLHSVTTRHSRIEYAARQCRFDAVAFTTRYWPLAAADLDGAAATVSR